MKYLIAILALPLMMSEANANTIDLPIKLDTKCWLGSLSFTEGVSMRVGKAIKVCSEGGAWSETPDLVSAICIYGGKAFSTGSIEKLSAANIGLKCLEDGTWEQIKTKK